MNETELVQLAGEALSLAMLILAPALGAAVVAGAFSAMLQAATQVQDAALSFAPKLLAVAAALYMSAGPVRERLQSFAAHVLQACG